MKKKLVWIASGTIIAILIGLIAAGNYFYNVAINRSQESVDLHGGGESVTAAKLLSEEEEQRKLEEILAWTEKQKFELVELESKDGLKLKARFLKNANPSGKAVILAHGYKGNSEQMPGITKFYYEQGYDILKPDARGHGLSEGDYIGYGWHDRKDYVQWSKFLAEEARADTIFLHGFSMGAATVLMASGEKLPDQVKGIIADSGYTTVLEELSHQLKYLYNLPSFPVMQVTSVITNIRAGYTFAEASALDSVAKNKVPLFIIHGDNDALVPTEMGIRIFEKAKSVKELWIVPGAGHTEAYTIAEKEYQEKLKSFWTKATGK
ncbi:alpha/beta hydrolase [Mesobacillus subterraneus]|uniref:alpha/beta hydrolase n=1 Tax=Mesobacillus subterraneus TaxID=285983 RepID=UPI001CFF33AE|nr:alpha/beta hydrolase [Mesobacillus subterraneus]WLR57177.1 alpha/beta hydrolase [Mesobacillus subterraneus]